MSHISRLVTTNTKGRSFNLAFDPLTLIVGPNFAGKTTVLDSIRLALIGKLPEAAKNADIFKMSSGSKMGIALHLSNDIVISRDHWSDGESVRSSGTDAAEYVTPLLNSAEYFGLTAGERLGYIAARLTGPAEKGAKDLMVELLARWRDAGIDTSAEGVEDLNRKIVSELKRGGMQECLNRILDKKDKKNFTLPAQYTHWNAIVGDRVGAVRTLAELKNREQECSAETIGEIREQIATIHKDLAEATERKGKFQQAKETSERTAERRKKITEWLAKPKGEHATVAKDFREKYEKVKAKFNTFGMRADSSASMQTTLDGLREKMNIARTGFNLTSIDVADARKRLEEVEHLESCPTCQAKKKGWKTAVVLTLKEALSVNEHRLENLEKAHAAAKASFELMEGTVKLRAQQEAEEKEVEDAMKTFEAAALEADRKDAEEKQSVENFRSELETTAAIFDPDDLASAEGDVRDRTAELQAAQERLQTATKLQQQLVSAVEAQEEHETASKILEAVKVAGVFLKEKQQGGTNKLIGGLLGTVNFFTKDIMVAPLALHENELGYFLPNGRFVQHDTFSGLEKLLTYCAMGCALSTTGRLRVALLDELGNLTTSMRKAILFRARQAVAAGMLDQVIGVVPLDPDEKAMEPFWKIITLEAK